MQLLTWWDIAKQVWRSSQEHDILDRAAQLGFYFLLSLFPALLCITTLIGMLPLQSITPQLMRYLQTILPHDSLSVVEKYLQQVPQDTGSSLVSLSLMGALVTASFGMMAMIKTLNTVYGVQETRPIWKIGGIAVLLTIGGAIFTISSMTLILVGENLSQRMADAVGIESVVTSTWTIWQWPIALVLMLLATSLIYYWGPNIKHSWRSLLPGSVFAVALWVVVCLGFKLYAENLMNYNLVYGSITGVIVLMIWLFMSGLVLLIGGEVNGAYESTTLTTPQPSNR